MTDTHIAAIRARLQAGEVKPAWTCAFCLRTLFSGNLPSDWDLVWQSPVCPECQERVRRDGGYAVVTCGKYANHPDQRPYPKHYIGAYDIAEALRAAGTALDAAAAERDAAQADLAALRSIVATKDTCWGAPRFDGTRLPVECVAAPILESGVSVADQMDDYETTEAQVNAAVHWWQAVGKSVGRVRDYWSARVDAMERRLHRLTAERDALEAATERQAKWLTNILNHDPEQYEVECDEFAYRRLVGTYRKAAKQGLGQTLDSEDGEDGSEGDCEARL